MDASPAVVAALHDLEGIAAQLGDAVQLPFADALFEVVTARHMLYHVTDPVRAIAEARRVLGPGGRFLAVVNHDRVLPRVNALVAQAVVRAGGVATPAWAPGVHTDNLPPMIEAVFGAVEVTRFDNELVFRAPDPLIRFAVAQLAFHGVAADSTRRAMIVDLIEQAARAQLARSGEWRDRKGYSISQARVG